MTLESQHTRLISARTGRLGPAGHDCYPAYCLNAWWPESPRVILCESPDTTAAVLRDHATTYLGLGCRRGSMVVRSPGVFERLSCRSESKWKRLPTGPESPRPLPNSSFDLRSTTARPARLRDDIEGNAWRRLRRCCRRTLWRALRRHPHALAMNKHTP